MFDITKITNISENSKNIAPGGMFFAIRGTIQNGENYIDDAVKNGADYIVVANDYPKDRELSGVEYIKCNNVRLYLSKLASQFYPNQPKNIVAVTGTNGKTSVTDFYRQICTFNGIRAANLGTNGLITGYSSDIKLTNNITSPDPLILHNILNKLYRDKCFNIALEASSHGLSQYRMDNVKLKAVAFTNFSQDHLDYHKDMNDYFLAKQRLFKEVISPETIAVLNTDIKEYDILQNICNERHIKVIDYGKNANKLKMIRHDDGICFVFEQKKHHSKLNLPTKFQKYNVLCAIGLALATGLEIDKIIAVIPMITHVPGRMEKVAEFNQAEIYVDYAHTPDALQKALDSLRHYCKAKLVVLFGCGGDRDHKKRPMMGEIASAVADLIIVTDDNPRYEAADKIRAEIIQATDGKALNIGDRKNAIEHAMSLLNNGDILLIAGKGHEEYQDILGTQHYFSDNEIIKQICHA